MNAPDNSGTGPNKGPNFGLIVALACVFLLFVLLASFFTIDWEGKRLVPRGFGKYKHPTSQLILSPSLSSGLSTVA